MDKSFFEWVKPKLTNQEFEILVNHTQPGPDGYIGLNVALCRKKYKIGSTKFKRLIEKFEDCAQTYERQVVLDGY